MSRSTIALGEVAARAEVLAVACDRCNRRGRLRIARLLAEHGPATPMPRLLRALTDDCPQHQSVSEYERCGAHFPDLPALFVRRS